MRTPTGRAVTQLRRSAPPTSHRGGPRRKPPCTVPSSGTLASNPSCPGSVTPPASPAAKPSQAAARQSCATPSRRRPSTSQCAVRTGTLSQHLCQRISHQSLPGLEPVSPHHHRSHPHRLLHQPREPRSRRPATPQPTSSSPHKLLPLRPPPPLPAPVPAAGLGLGLGPPTPTQMGLCRLCQWVPLCLSPSFTRLCRRSGRYARMRSRSGAKWLCSTEGLCRTWLSPTLRCVGEGLFGRRCCVVVSTPSRQSCACRWLARGRIFPPRDVDASSAPHRARLLALQL